MDTKEPVRANPKVLTKNELIVLLDRIRYAKTATMDGVEWLVNGKELPEEITIEFNESSI